MEERDGTRRGCVEESSREPITSDTPLSSIMIAYEKEMHTSDQELSTVQHETGETGVENGSEEPKLSKNQLKRMKKEQIKAKKIPKPKARPPDPPVNQSMRPAYRALVEAFRDDPTCFVRSFTVGPAGVGYFFFVLHLHESLPLMTIPSFTAEEARCGGAKVDSRLRSRDADCPLLYG